MRKHSTDHAIVSILDFSKAFDTVNRNILIEKLDYYGIRGVTKDWFISYLTDRYQYVSLGQTESDPHPVSCGVSQGSVLGPLSFLVDVNDFSYYSEILDFHLYADDANLFYKRKNLKVLESKVNNELVNIHTWLTFVIFHPPRRKLPFHIILSLNSFNLNQEYSIKYLSIVIYSN